MRKYSSSSSSSEVVLTNIPSSSSSSSSIASSALHHHRVLNSRRLSNEKISSSLSASSSTSHTLCYSEASRILSQIPFIQFNVSHSNIDQDSLYLVSQIFSSWDPNHLVVSRCTDGITNKLLRIENTKLGKTILIRCYGHGTSAIIDRKNELISIIILSALGFAPPIYGRFENGFCYGYADGRVLTPDEISSLDMGVLIAKTLAKWHRIPFPVERKSLTGVPMIWETMKRWLDQVPRSYNAEKYQKQYVKHDFLCPIAILKELESLQSDISESTTSKIVFCHNDLLAANIIYKPPLSKLSSSKIERNSDPLQHIDSTDSSESTGGEVSFIDFEYGSYSYAAFDIANHFNEYAGFECDYSKFPKLEYQKEWIRGYLSEFNEREADNDEIDALYRDVQKFALVSHFFWAIWALVQASVSDIDFDYMEYSIMRFTEYYRLKHRV